jgi:hypothetical protein
MRSLLLPSDTFMSPLRRFLFNIIQETFPYKPMADKLLTFVRQKTPIKPASRKKPIPTKTRRTIFYRLKKLNCGHNETLFTR